jgi:hypothetical protein
VNFTEQVAAPRNFRMLSSKAHHLFNAQTYGQLPLFPYLCILIKYISSFGIPHLFAATSRGAKHDLKAQAKLHSAHPTPRKIPHLYSTTTIPFRWL